MRNRKLTAVFLGTVFALGLIAGGYGAFGEDVYKRQEEADSAFLSPQLRITKEITRRKSRSTAPAVIRKIFFCLCL